MRKELIRSIFENNSDSAKAILKAAGDAALRDLNVWDKQGRVPLHYVAEKKEKKWAQIIELLLEMGCDPETRSYNGWTAMHSAANSTNEYSCAALILHGNASVNVMTYHCYTPLHFASRKCHLPTMRLLIRHGAACNAINNWNQTPLELSLDGQSETSKENRKQAQKLLLRHGAMIGSEVQIKSRDDLIKELKS